MKIKIGDKFISLLNEPNTIYGGYITGSIRIEQELNVRSICNFTLWHIDSSIRYRKGLSCEIYTDNDELIYAGFVETVKFKREEDAFYHEITCIDNRYLADKRIVAYAKANTRAGIIVEELFDMYLIDESVTIGEIQPGPEITETVFNYVPLARALDRLAESIGFVWYIDNQRKLYFVSRATYAAPWALTYVDVNGQPEIEHGNLKYRNTQYILDAKNITSVQQVIRQGDGLTKTFLVDYPLAKKPKIEVSIAGNPYVEITEIGIKGVDTGKKWYWNKNEYIITQDESEPELSNNDYVRITYQGFEEIIVKLVDRVAIDEMRDTEIIGSGIVEEIARRPDIGTIQAAYEAAAEELDKNVQVGDRIKFRTIRPGLKPGQLLKIELPRYDLDDEFLVESVTIEEEVKGLIWYEVIASRGIMYEHWAKMFAKMFYHNEPLVIRENISEKEFLRVLVEFYRAWQESDIPNIFTELYPAEDLYPADNVFPMFDPDDRIKYVEAFDAEENSLGRKYFTSQTSKDGDIKTRFFVQQNEFNGDIAELRFYGGLGASIGPLSGIEIDRQAYVHAKTTLEALQIQRRDVKMF